MAKQQSSQKQIFKIHSSRLRRNKWRLDLSIQMARKNNEVISLSDSSVLRFIKDITKYEFPEDKIKSMRKEIKKIRKQFVTIENKLRIKNLYHEIDKNLFVNDYVCIIMDSQRDFDRCNIKKGFFINGVKYIRLVGTTGGIKKETIVYASERVHNELALKLDNGRNKDIPIVAAKLEAYKSLSCSVSIPVSKPKGVLVIKDGETNFKANIIKIDDTNSEYPLMTEEKDYPINLSFCDGCAMILPSLSKKWALELGEDYIPSGYNMRNSWCKGMVFTFDFIDFAEKIAKSYMVEDAWGNLIDIRTIDLVLTTNMLKLWNSYDNIDHYLECCEHNGYTFSVAKICPKELENERNMNYQFLQSYDFSDEDIDKLIYPTINEIHDVLGGDYKKTLLFLRGIHLTDKTADTEEYDYVKALMIEPKMIEDPFVKQRVHNMIEKRITDAKIGVIKVVGNYSIVAGDVYALCQYMFKMKVTGLLKKDEYYARTWLDKGINKVVAFRAPMTCHNNIKIMNLVNKNCADYWFRYMTTCTVINAWDTTTHAMNGMDEDSDAIITSNNEVLLNNTKILEALVCVQKSARKKIANEKDLIQSNKDGFGDDIGSTTNRITGMFEVLWGLEKDSPEYNELLYRIMCGQHFQQCAIDKAKGIISKPMPKEWYEYKPNKIEDTDSEKTKLRKEFNLKILANKKPYFFTYIYPKIMNDYKKFICDSDTNCLISFGLTVNELKEKEIRTEEENTYLKYYEKQVPVGMKDCVMNKICRKVEKEFDGILNKVNYADFDYNILKSDAEYSNTDYRAIKELYTDYNRVIRQYSQTIKKERVDKDEKKARREIFKQNFKQKAFEICNNQDSLCNIVIDLCYTSISSKQFAWDIVGESIIHNLLKKNNHKISYPIRDDNGDIEFGGYWFSMQDKFIKKEVDVD